MTARSGFDSYSVRAVAPKSLAVIVAAIPSRASWPRSGSRPTIRTVAPSRASPAAIALPIPEVAPVTSVVLSVRRWVDVGPRPLAEAVADGGVAPDDCAVEDGADKPQQVVVDTEDAHFA
jgi:hypothetical protein